MFFRSARIVVSFPSSKRFVNPYSFYSSKRLLHSTNREGNPLYLHSNKYTLEMEVVYEDNHLIVVFKKSGEIVQGDKTGDTPLSEMVKSYLKVKYAKPGNVYLGVAHRLDRPVSGLVVFAKTSKALTRLNDMFRKGEVHKTYWALTRNTPAEARATLVHWLVRNEKSNKSFAHTHEVSQSKKAILSYCLLGASKSFSLIEVELHTGRHHQIRCQLAAMGCPIKGDLKYGSPRSNPDGGISLVAVKLSFQHPVSKQTMSFTVSEHLLLQTDAAFAHFAHLLSNHEESQLQE